MNKSEFKRGVVRGVVMAGLALVIAGVAQAQTVPTGPDLSSLTSAVDVGTVITAVLAICASLAGLYLAIMGGKTVLRMIKGG